MTRWKHGNRREGSTCAPTANSREGATSNVPNVSGLELCGSSDHAEVAEVPRVRQAGNPAELGTTSHICHPTGTSSHVPESSPRGPGSAPPGQKGSRSGTPRNVRPSASEIRRTKSKNPEKTSVANGSKIKGKQNSNKEKEKEKENHTRSRERNGIAIGIETGRRGKKKKNERGWGKKK